MEQQRRPTWDEYFSEIASVIAKRSTCDRKSVGAVIVDIDNRIVSTGYNGSPDKTPHCDDVGHLLATINGRDSCIRTVHAENNAIIYAGREVIGCSIYVTVIPCYNCALMIVNAGIDNVIWSEYYLSQNTRLVMDLFAEAGIVCR